MTAPRILILYSRTGGGHVRVAHTLREHLLAAEPSAQVTLVDGLELTDLGVRVDPARGFLTVTTTLIHLYNLNYRFTNHRRTLPLLRRTIQQTYGRTLTRIATEHQPDFIISTHHFISPSTFSSPVGLPPFYMVVSDLGKPHRLWFDPHTRAVYVPSDDMAAYAASCLGRTDPAEIRDTVLSLGFPIDAGNERTAESHEPRRQLLVMGGGAGTGSLGKIVDELTRGFPDHKIVVVCGWNHRLKQRIERWERPNLEVHGFVQTIPELMAASDMVITKAGPVTIMEAVAAGRPLVVTNWIGLQERDNVNFVVNHGLGLYCDEPAHLCEAVRSIYERYADFVAAKPVNVQHGPKRIALDMLEKWRNLVDPQPSPRLLSLGE